MMPMILIREVACCVLECFTRTPRPSQVVIAKHKSDSTDSCPFPHTGQSSM